MEINREIFMQHTTGMQFKISSIAIDDSVTELFKVAFRSINVKSTILVSFPFQMV